MADPSIVFWTTLPGGSKLTASATQKPGTPGTFAATGSFLDHTGNSIKIQQLPFSADLKANNSYQLVLEILPVGGAVVDVSVVVTKGGQAIRKTNWAPIQGGPGMRGVFARTEKA
jgi:hypothetical protein